MRLKSVILLMCATLSLGVAAEAKTPKPYCMHYEATMKSASFGNMGTRKLWIKGDRLRFESYAGKLPLRLVKNKQGLFLINPFKKVAAKYPPNSLRGNPMTLLPGPAGPPMGFLKSVNAVRHGQKMVNKQLCKIYDYTEPTTKLRCELSISARSNKPVQLIIKGRHKAQDTVTVTYTKFEEDSEIADALFELPKGYPITSMPNLDLTSKKVIQQHNSKRSG